MYDGFIDKFSDSYNDRNIEVLLVKGYVKVTLEDLKKERKII